MYSDIMDDPPYNGETEAEKYKRLLKMVMEALIAVQTMRQIREPKKLEEALSWRENDELAERKYHEALAAIRKEIGE